MAEDTEEIKGVVGDYIVTFRPEIGRGTFGSVYKAEHKRTKKIYAAKEIKLTENGERNHEKCRMAERELDIILSLQEHPNIIQLAEPVFKPDACFIFMEFCEHGDLKKYLLKNKTLGLFAKIKIMHEMASAFSFMHSQSPPIIHRDIKFENILMQHLDGEDIVKIVDFGLSKIFEEKLTASLSQGFVKGKYMTTACGTAYFMAPEFFAELDSGLKYDGSVDVFALGLVYAVVLEYDQHEDFELLPLSVKMRENGQYVNIGAEMLNSARRHQPLPELFKTSTKDNTTVKKLKQLIKFMTQYNCSDRQNIQEVEEELCELYCYMEERAGVQALLEQADINNDDLAIRNQPPASAAAPKGQRQHSEDKEKAKKKAEAEAKFINKNISQESAAKASPVVKQPNNQEKTKKQAEVEAKEKAKAKAQRAEADRIPPINGDVALVGLKLCGLKHEKDVKLADTPMSMQLIQGDLWCCSTAGISIYSRKLKLVKTLREGGKGKVYRVADTGDQVVVAASRGLFVTTYKGTGEKKIVDGCFTDVAYQGGRIYACYQETSSSPVHVYDTKTWRRIDVIKLECGGEHYHTVRITGNDVILGCSDGDVIFALSMNGEIQGKLGSYGEAVGMFRYLHVCQVDEDGAMLIADEWNDRLQLYHGREWSVLKFKCPKRPTAALFTSGALYVSSDSPKLSMYLPQ